MAQIRVEKDKNFSIVSNEILRDTSLSIKARFILVFCLSLSDSWEYNIKGLATVIGVGVDTISAGLKELESHGYLERKRVRDEKGRLKNVEYILREKPKREKPILENPILDKPILEKPTLINKDIINNQSKKEPKKKRVEKAPCEDIVSIYNETCVSLPSVGYITSGRITAINARWLEYKGDIETFRRLFEIAQASDFLTGRNERGWKASFDWLMNAKNMAKVLEGNYENRQQKQEEHDDLADFIERERGRKSEQHGCNSA